MKRRTCSSSGCPRGRYASLPARQRCCGRNRLKKPEAISFHARIFQGRKTSNKPLRRVLDYMKTISSLFLAAFTLAAQVPRSRGHAYFGIDAPPSDRFDYSSAGFGGDFFIYKGAAFSPSGGWVFRRGSIGRGAAAITLNGSYHFLRGKSRFEPFVSAGYGVITNFGSSELLFNYGGGGQYWFNKHLGVRAEILNFQHQQFRELTSVRFGIAFR